jgi:predicted TIM-barrel fold metal-dependent hydrolase
LHLKWTTNHLEWCEEAGFPFLSLFRQFRNHFGAERLMWGSNYPARSQPSYEAMVQKALDAIKPLPVSEQELVIGGTALSLWPELA